MQRPADYDSSEARRGAGEKPTAGPYIMKILYATEQISSSGRPMFVLWLDINDGPFKDNFKKLHDFLKQKRSDAKWPCVYRRCTDGDQTPYFKGDIKSIEESNSGFIFNFDENQLLNKIVGCVLGEKEINADGKTVLEPRFLCSTKTAISGELKAPKVKKFEGSKSGFDCGGSSQTEEDLPF